MTLILHPPPELEKAEQETSRYAAVFLEYKAELDARHDKHERLVKLSRDTTILSKRAIFLLHRAAGAGDPSQLLQEGEGKLREVCQILRAMAEELRGTDPWLHRTAFSPGLQEFVEALSYYVFLRQGQLLGLEEARLWLSFSEQEAEGDAEREAEGEAKGMAEDTSDSTSERGKGGTGCLEVPLSELNYVLGIADLTGELMRMSITAVGAGQQEVPFELLPFIRAIYCGFHSLMPISGEILHKLRTLRSSMAKIEGACYALRIRGSEIPQHMMGDVFLTPVEGAGNANHFD